MKTLSSLPGSEGLLSEQELSPDAPKPRRSYRPVIASFGLACVVVAELLPPSSPQGLFAAFGFFALLVAAILMLVPKWDRHPATALEVPKAEPRYPGATWRWTLAGLGLFGLVVAQTWFRSGTVIAGGDIAPPIGTAWIGRIFNTYGWSGANLGGPQANQGQLPFGVVDELVHLAGGSGALAQRIWLSLLIAGVVVAGAALARSLIMSPLAGVCVGIFFFFNPMTLSQVSTNDVYLAAMVLVATLPALVISYGRGTLKRWQLNLGFVVAAPFVGFIYANPPLVGMLVLTVLATPLLVWVRFGRDTAVRTWWGLLLAGTLMAGASAYWLIPNLLASSSIASGTLSSVSAWAFTESRSTLANGFWLNTAWGWNFSEYYPYAHLFRQFPIALVRPLIPLLALFGLTLRSPGKDQRVLSRSTRLGGLLSVFVLGLILLSNGTRAPGSLIFDPLYHLPYGWLLREPGRFLMVVALGYALLIGLLVDRVGSRVRTPLSPTPSGGPNTVGTTRVSWSRWLMVSVVAVALVSAFPLWTGLVVSGPHDGFPSGHVVVPSSWTATADYLNSSKAPRGSLLVLPPDDFYQMPYTWYYGNDGFIPNLLDRHVVVPSGGSYYNVSSELLGAVQLEASALTSHNWTEASRILTAIGTPILLVRGDIEATFPGRDIVSPAALSAALTNDPDMHLVHRIGPLSLYELNSQYRLAPTNYATTFASTPDLRLLAVLPQRTALISSPPQAGHAVIAPLPPCRIGRSNRTG
jgi:arabinofuranan 3-O-arabinosyltransferase